MRQRSCRPFAVTPYSSARTAVRPGLSDWRAAVSRRTIRTCALIPPGRARTRPGVGLGLPPAAASREGHAAGTGGARRPHIADTTDAYRVLETSHPPVYYIPRADSTPGVADRRATVRRSASSRAWPATSTSAGERGPRAPGTTRSRARVRGDGRPRRVLPGEDGRLLGRRRAGQPQEGDFYGGWVTSDIVGPFKGAPGTWGW